MSAEWERSVFALADGHDPRASPRLRACLVHSLEVIERGMAEYGLDGVGISFNGGKDCTVLLVLYWAAYWRHIRTNIEAKAAPPSAPAAPAADEAAPRSAAGVEGNVQQERFRPKTIYVAHSRSFPEVEQFVGECVERIEGDMKQSLAKFLEDNKHIKAILVGTRSTDPYSSNLKPFAPTDPNWPQFMRINPILDWSYADIWEATRLLAIPYCVLYDRGYTSLGSTLDTIPNPALQDPSDPEKYLPAYMLEDGSLERNGRGKR